MESKIAYLQMIQAVIARMAGNSFPSCPKMRTEPKSRILEALSKFAETGRHGTGSAIGDPEQSSPSDHPLRPACAPELLWVLPPSSVGEMTLRLYGALSYSQNSARDLRCALNGA